MPGYGHGRRRRGRCRGQRWIDHIPEPIYYRPNGATVETNTVLLTLDELEALRLVDLEDLNQEDAAHCMGVSRKTLWNDLHRARKKVTHALVHGHAIRIQGGDYIPRT